MRKTALSLVALTLLSTTNPLHALYRPGAAPELVTQPANADDRGALVRNASLDFYTPPPVVPRQPGRLLRAEPIFAKWTPKRARSWRILYTTTDEDGSTTVASALVIVPQQAAGARRTPANVIAWAHGTTGIDRESAPSLDRIGLEAGAMYLGQQVIDRGWAMVATDYVGLGTPGPHKYLVGRPAAHAVLDSLRAADALSEVSLSHNIIVWGHSQGGGVALWTGIEAPHYAPELPIQAIAALAPAADLPATIATFPRITGGDVLTAYTIQGYSSAYRDVDFDYYVRPEARQRVHDMAAHGLKTASTIGSALMGKIFNRPIWLHDPTTGPLGRRLEENRPTGPILVPLLIAQGVSDQVVPPSATERYVQARRVAGGRVDFREFPGDHVGVVKPGSPLVPQLLDWTARHFGGDLS